MSFLRSLGRWLVRLVTAALLVGVGVIAFQWSKYSPRCVIASDTHAIHFSDDGGTLITGYSGTGIGNILQSGDGQPPVKVWDTRSGVVVRSLFNDVKSFKHFEVNAQQHLVAIDRAAGRIRVGDWQSGDEWEMDAGRGIVDRLSFSKGGESLAVNFKESDEAGVLIDVPTRTIVKRFGRGAWYAHFNADGSHYYYNLNDRLYVWNTKERRIERTVPRGHFSPDERLLVSRSADDCRVMIYDGATIAELARIQPAWPPGLNHEKYLLLPAPERQKILDSRSHELSPSGKRIATHALPWGGVNGALEIWDTATGRRHAAFPSLQRGWAWFFDDDTLLFFDRSETPLDPVAIANAGSNLIETAVLIDVPSATIRWRRPASLGNLCLFHEKTAVHISPNGAWEILDLDSGAMRCSLPHPFAAGAFMISWRDDKGFAYAQGRRREPAVPEFLQKWLKRWIPAESGAVQIVDVKSSRIVFELNTDVNSGAVVSKDGKTLLSFDLSWGLGPGAIGPARPAQPMYHFRFYDLDSNAPWFWAFAVPAVLLLIGFLWRRWRLWRHASGVSRIANNR